MLKIPHLILAVQFTWLFSCLAATPPNLGLHFSGASSYFAVTNSISLSSMNAFTFEAYVLFESVGTDNPRIISKGWEANDGLEFGFIGTGGSRQLFVDGFPTSTDVATVKKALMKASAV